MQELSQKKKKIQVAASQIYLQLLWEKEKGMTQDTIYFLLIELSWYNSVLRLQMTWDPLTNCIYHLKFKKESFLI